MQPTTAHRLHEALVQRREALIDNTLAHPSHERMSYSQAAKLVDRQLDKFEAVSPKVSAEEAIRRVAGRKTSTILLSAIGWTAAFAAGVKIYPDQAQEVAKAAVDVTQAFLFGSPEVSPSVLWPLVGTYAGMGAQAYFGASMWRVHDLAIEEARALVEASPLEFQSSRAPVAQASTEA